jgi:hypothetical protein
MANTIRVMRASYYGLLHLVPSRYGRDTLRARCACRRPNRLTRTRDTDPLSVAMAVERYDEDLSSHCVRAARKEGVRV